VIGVDQLGELRKITHRCSVASRPASRPGRTPV
jgi:hypothetical protein